MEYEEVLLILAMHGFNAEPGYTHSYWHPDHKYSQIIVAGEGADEETILHLYGRVARNQRKKIVPATDIHKIINLIIGE